MSDKTNQELYDKMIEGFNMSIEDAKQLHAWLGVVLNGS